MSALRLAIFDVDGTISDSFGLIEAAMAAAFQDAGRTPPEPAETRGVVGLSLADAMRVLLPHDGDEVRSMVGAGYKSNYIRLRSQAPEMLFPGAVEVLRAFQTDGWLMGLATGKSRRGVDVFLDRHDLRGVFDVVRTADDGPGKPHPFMVADAAASLGVEPQQAVMIGDSRYDMAMARDARSFALGVTWGAGQADELRQAGAHEVAEAMDAVFDLGAALLR